MTVEEQLIILKELAEKISFIVTLESIKGEKPWLVNKEGFLIVYSPLEEICIFGASRQGSDRARFSLEYTLIEDSLLDKLSFTF